LLSYLFLYSHFGVNDSSIFRGHFDQILVLILKMSLELKVKMKMPHFVQHIVIGRRLKERRETCTSCSFTHSSSIRPKTPKNISRLSISNKINCCKRLKLFWQTVSQAVWTLKPKLSKLLSWKKVSACLSLSLSRPPFNLYQ
jgi:hypothetical protein